MRHCGQRANRLVGVVVTHDARRLSRSRATTRSARSTGLCERAVLTPVDARAGVHFCCKEHQRYSWKLEGHKILCTALGQQSTKAGKPGIAKAKTKPKAGSTPAPSGARPASAAAAMTAEVKKSTAQSQSSAPAAAASAQSRPNSASASKPKQQPQPQPQPQPKQPLNQWPPQSTDLDEDEIAVIINQVHKLLARLAL